jgi:hypothetical protein
MISKVFNHFERIDIHMREGKRFEETSKMGRVWGIFINVRVVHLSLTKGDAIN